MTTRIFITRPVATKRLTSPKSRNSARRRATGTIGVFCLRIVFSRQKRVEFVAVIDCVHNRKLRPILIRRGTHLQPPSIVENAIHTRPEPAIDPRDHLCRWCVWRCCGKRLIPGRFERGELKHHDWLFPPPFRDSPLLMLRVSGGTKDSVQIIHEVGQFVPQCPLARHVKGSETVPSRFPLLFFLLH